MDEMNSIGSESLVSMEYGCVARTCGRLSCDVEDLLTGQRFPLVQPIQDTSLGTRAKVDV